MTFVVFYYLVSTICHNVSDDCLFDTLGLSVHLSRITYDEPP